MHRRADDELTRIIEGSAGDGRADVRATRLVLDLRSAFRDAAPPAPTAELASLLDPTYLAEASARAAGTQAAAPAPPARPSHPRRRWVGWLTGLSLAWQVGLGSTAAFAAVGGAGVAGALPAPAQDVFDRVLTTVMPFGRDTDDAGKLPVEDRSTPVDQGRPEQTAGPGAGGAPADQGREDRSRRDERGQARKQAVPGGDHRPESPDPAPGRPGVTGSEGAGPRDRDRHPDRGPHDDAAADEAADAADEAADEAEETADEAEETADEHADAAEEAQDAADGARDDR